MSRDVFKLSPTSLALPLHMRSQTNLFALGSGEGRRIMFGLLELLSGICINFHLQLMEAVNRPNLQ